MTYPVSVYIQSSLLALGVLLASPGVAAAAPAAPGAGTVVAVLDTGITAHPALGWTRDPSGRGVAGGQVLAGFDFVSDAWAAADGDGWDSDPSDRGDGVRRSEAPPRCAGSRSSWHGTNVAGTIAKVAPGASILPIRIMGRCGGSTADVAAAILWAIGDEVPGVPVNPTPATIVNMSLSGPSDSCPRALQTAIDAAVARGVAIVAAAGSSSMNTAGETPANCSNVIVVGSTDRQGKRSPTSGFGTEVTLSALGGNMTVVETNGIRTTTNKGRYRPGEPGYGYYQSSSAAAARVSAALAEVAAAHPAENAAQWRARLLNSLDPFAPGACDVGEGQCGKGILDLKRLQSSL